MATNTLPTGQDACIFCGKLWHCVKASCERLITCETDSTEFTIKQCALDKQNYALLSKIDGIDMSAKEVLYRVDEIILGVRIVNLSYHLMSIAYH